MDRKKSNRNVDSPLSVDSSKVNGWNEYALLVLNEIERLNIKIENIEVGIVGIKVDIAKLQVKSGVWGLVGGSISVLVTVLFLLLKSGKLLP